MGLFSLEKLFGITIRESATDGSDFTNPDADYRRLFLGEDGQLHAKDSAGAITDIGVTTGSGTPHGTSFPGGPATYAHFIRDDLAMEFFWNGTRWLSTQLFEIEKNFGNQSGSQGLVVGTAFGAPNSLWLVDVRWGYNIAGTHNTSNYWTMEFRDCNRASGVQGPVIASDKSTGSSVTVATAPTAIGITWPYYSSSYGMFDVQKIGGPGNIYWTATARYRIIGT